MKYLSGPPKSARPPRVGQHYELVSQANLGELRMTDWLQLNASPGTGGLACVFTDIRSIGPSSRRGVNFEFICADQRGKTWSGRVSNRGYTEFFPA